MNIQLDTYIINKLFTIPSLDRLIYDKKESKELISAITRKTILEDNSIGEIISKIYQYMGQNYRNEYFYKNTLLNKLLIEKHDVLNTATLTELPIGESKADIVMINGKGIVYEIKTDLDNLTRLESQVRDYYKVFSYVYVVSSKKQINKLKERFSETPVGIYELTNSGNLLKRKKAKFYSENLDYDAMFELLRKKEFEQIILNYYGHKIEADDFSYYRECRKAIKKINIRTLQKAVMECLKNRTVITAEEKCKLEDIPMELRFYSYFSKQDRLDNKKILQVLGERLER